MTNFPFGILDVIYALNIPIRKRHNDEAYIDCPHCFFNPKTGHSGKGKAQVIISQNVYNCPRCGNGGGMLDLYSSVSGCDKKTANREMRRFVNDKSYQVHKEQIKKIVKTAEESVVETTQLAPRKEIDRTYRAFLSLCELRREHKNNLLNRGLTGKNIAHYGFKSTPSCDKQNSIISDLIKKGYTLKGVPGFYLDNNNWRIDISDWNQGFFVPMCNLKNQCLGLQIRLDKPTEKQKYVWLSSKRKKGGCGRTSVPHITNTFDIGESVYITEGGLKADIAHCISKGTFVAIAGVSQFSVLPLLFSQLRMQGVKRIIDSYDSDCKYNPNVEKARTRLKQEVIKAGLEYYRMEWDENYKGIDDYLFAVPRGSRKFIVYDK